MQVIRAESAGFCMGVALALRKLDRAIKESEAGRHIATLGPIIHNPQVLAEYERQGVGIIKDAVEAAPGDCVIIRAHGIPIGEECKLRERDAQIVDATCPKVKKAQLAIARATEKGETLLLFGEKDHPEVRGLISYAKGPAHVFADKSELEHMDFSSEHCYVLASQTTQNKNNFEELEDELKKHCKCLRVLSTICGATQRRQEEARELADQVEIMIVLGGRDSGNTRRLADIAAAAGARTTHVESMEELFLLEFEKNCIAGLTAGASTPKSLVDSAEQFLRSV